MNTKPIELSYPTEYLNGTTHFPESPDDFIGGARKAAQDLKRTVEKAKARQFAPIKLMYAGSAGIGKSALTYYAQKLLNVSKWALVNINGTDVTIEQIREWNTSIHYCHDTSHGDYRLWCIHESDKMSSQAQVGFLSLMDKLPNRTAVICTTNQTIGTGDKVERERFQTRFKYTEILPPDPPELSQFLQDKFSVPQDVANEIALSVNGNVRAACLEAEEYMDTQENKP